MLLLPGVGGDVGDFSLWPRHLAPTLRPLTARYPGRGTGPGEEPAAGPGTAPADLAGFAADLADAVLLHTTEPLLILGHSMGALVGYEVAWHLQQRRRPAFALHAFAAFSPPEYASFDLNSGTMTDRSLTALTENLAILLPGGTGTPERAAMLRAVRARADLALIDTYAYGPRPRPLAYPITVRGVATGWLPGKLSEQGGHFAAELGARRRDTGPAAVFVSDLHRAVETAQIAFAGTSIPIHQDPRRRECNYGELNGCPVTVLAAERARHIDVPFPGGQSYREVIEATNDFLHDLGTEWQGRRVLVIAHSANKWALDCLLTGASIEDLVDAPFNWQEGWHYTLPTGRPGRAPDPTVGQPGVPSRS
ncbi:histidine phosphatase family protein [Streptomyces klenkii]|uniref:histidine phosphatase family protein n=1 Tax=Streptomyces klenkii TaxID=1420899 RepID=UPI00340817C7